MTTRRTGMRVTQYNLDQWARFADAAAAAGHKEVSERMTEAAEHSVGEMMPLAEWDMLQGDWRAWLCRNEFPAGDRRAI